ncbi:hypothetical protein JCM10450v2_006059 [Rhodotorula kratochvilovae]
MEVDHDDAQSPGAEREPEPWETTRAGKRVAELKEVEENLAAVLHFAGCTLASLHPDPLSSFTSRELATDEDDAAGGPGADAKKPEGDDKLVDFAKYAEGFYATLNDVQLGLRTSIRHLRVARTSAAPLVDPSFASLVAAGGSSTAVGPGGVAAASLLGPLSGGLPAWKGSTERLPAKEPVRKENGETKLSVAALELEREAWADLVRALEAGR